MIRPAGVGTSAQVIPLHRPIIETHVVIARHRSRCAAELCRSPIRAGELIQRVDGKYMHEECVPFHAIKGFADQEAA